MPQFPQTEEWPSRIWICSSSRPKTAETGGYASNQATDSRGGQVKAMLAWFGALPLTDPPVMSSSTMWVVGTVNAVAM